MAEVSGRAYESKWTGAQIDEVIEFFHNNSELITETLPEVSAKIINLENNLNSTSMDLNSINSNLRNYLPLRGGTMDDASIIRGKQTGTYSSNGAIDTAFIQIHPSERSTGVTNYLPIFSAFSKIDGSGKIKASFSCGVTKDNTLSFRYNEGSDVEMFYGTPNGVLMGAAWNDYAEFRESDELEAGRVVCENGDGTLSRSIKRLQAGAEVVSDTFGFAIGKTEKCQTPVAVTGRVLAYPYEDWWTFEPGEAVCAGPNGTVSKMTRREIRKYPERIIGTVSELPTYEIWGNKQIPVNGRIWIRMK